MKTIKIKRTVDGIEREFELTENELDSAYDTMRLNLFAYNVKDCNKYGWSENDIYAIADEAKFLTYMYGYADLDAIDIAIEKYNEEHGFEEENVHDDYAEYQWGC